MESLWCYNGGTKSLRWESGLFNRVDCIAGGSIHPRLGHLVSLEELPASEHTASSLFSKEFGRQSNTYILSSSSLQGFGFRAIAFAVDLCHWRSHLFDSPNCSAQHCVQLRYRSQFQSKKHAKSGPLSSPRSVCAVVIAFANCSTNQKRGIPANRTTH